MYLGFSNGSLVKNLPANARDTSPIPGSGRSPGGGNGNPHHNSCLEKVHGQRSPVDLQSMGNQSLTQLRSMKQQHTTILTEAIRCTHTMQHGWIVKTNYLGGKKSNIKEYIKYIYMKKTHFIGTRTLSKVE